MQKDKIKRTFGADTLLYLPFFVVFLVSLAYHIKMQPMGGDDPFFAQALEGTTVWDYLENRYIYWTSRVVLEGILVFVVQAPWLWRILDCLIFATMPCFFASLADTAPNRILGKKTTDQGDWEKSCLIHWCAAGGMLLFPFHDMGTAGWMTTTETHFWPLWGCLFLAVVLKKLLLAEKLPVWMAALSVPVCIMMCSHEQYAVIWMVLLVLAAIYAVKNGRIRRKGFPMYGLFCTIGAISLTVILLCPGNAARNAVSLADLPVYGTFGFFEKLYLGLLGIERVFIANVDIVFYTVTLLLAVLVYIQTKHYRKTLAASLPFLILIGYTLIRTSFPGLSGLFPVPGEVLEWSWRELSTWLPMFYLAVTVGAIIFGLYQIFGENRMIFWFILILLGCGFGAGAVLGFMATIYVSGERVYAALYVILILVMIAGVGKAERGIREALCVPMGKLLATFLGMLCFVNVVFLWLSV